jgi:hypothetical protein
MNKALLDGMPIGYVKSAVRKVTADAYSMYKGVRPKRHTIGVGPKDEATEDGGAGSGNWSHEGIPGYHGGSAPNYQKPRESEGIRKGEIVTYRDGDKIQRAQVLKAQKEGETTTVWLRNESGKVVKLPIEKIEDIESHEVGYGMFKPSEVLKLNKDSDEWLNNLLGESQRALNRRLIESFKDESINKWLGKSSKEYRDIMVKGGKKNGSNTSPE